MGNEIELLYGKALPKSSRLEGKYPVFGSNGIVGFHNEALVNGPGIIVGRKGSCGAVHFSTSDFWPIDTTYYIALRKEHDWRFMAFFLSTFELGEMNSHSTIPGLNRGDVYKLKCHIPPFSEQQKIAAVLFKIQKAIEVQEAIIEKMRELKRSTLHNVFTHGLRGEKLKETVIGPMPGNWNLVRIKDIVSETSQADPSRTPDRKIKYIDVSSVSNTRYVIETWINVLGKQAPSRARKVVKEGDAIVAAVRPTLRRLAFITSDFDNEICSTAFCVLRPRNDVLDPKFLFYSTQRDEFFAGLEKLQQGASYPAVTDSDIKDQQIPLPPIEEQKEIAQVFQTIDQKIDLHTAKKSALQDLFKTMLNKLMTGEIRVKDLDVDVSEVEA